MRRDIETRFKPKPDSFSRVPLSTYLDKQTDALVRSLPNRSEWLRRVITEAAHRELTSDSLGVAMVKDRSESIATPRDNPSTHKSKEGCEGHAEQR